MRLLGCLLLGGLGCSGQPAKSPPAPKPPDRTIHREVIQAARHAAQQLRAGETKWFVDEFVIADGKPLSSAEKDQFLKQMGSGKSWAAHLDIASAGICLLESKTDARLMAGRPKQPDIKPRPPGSAAAKPPAGFGTDLRKAIKRAVSQMDQGPERAADATFRLLPETQSRWLVASENVDRFRRREAARFAVGDRVILDRLREIQKQEPRIIDEGTVAIFSIEEASKIAGTKKQRSFEVRFELSGSHWRLFDDGPDYYQKLQSFASRLSPRWFVAPRTAAAAEENRRKVATGV